MFRHFCAIFFYKALYADSSYYGEIANLSKGSIVKIPIFYSFKSVLVRFHVSIMAIFGIAIVSAVFVMILALADGFEHSLTATGSASNVKIMRKGASFELPSMISREQIQIIEAAAIPFAEKNSKGDYLISAELLGVIRLPSRTHPEQSINVGLRGVNPISQDLRPELKIVEGRWFESGKNEIIAGSQVLKRAQGVGFNEIIRFSNRDWKIVGTFDSGGGAFDSEIFGDAEELANALQRDEPFQSVTIRLRDVNDFSKLSSELMKDPRLTISAYPEKDYYLSLSGNLKTLIVIIGSLVVGIMSLGAIAGAINTMNGAIISRAKEIGTLRALGFSKLVILLSFFIEICFISLIGGAVGCLLSLFFDGIETGTMNIKTFSDVGFRFTINKSYHFPAALVFSMVMGLIGGLIPAIRGANQKIVSSLRQL